jgi:natural product precursor
MLRGRDSMKKKLTLSKETLRTLDDQELSLVAGGNNSGSNVPPVANGCPSSKGPGNSCH